MAKAPVWVGIDVSRDTLDIAFHPTGQTLQVPNTEEGLAPVLRQLRKQRPALVLYEPTNRYHDLLASLLAAAKLPIREANPAKARAFARSLGTDEKTDRIDARMLARYAEVLREPRPLPDAATRELAAHVTRRRQLCTIRAEEQKRRRSTATALRPGIDEHIAWLSERIDDIDRTISQLIAAHSTFAERAAVLRSAKGVGPVLSATLLAALPELGSLSRRQIAKLVGVAPLARSSGQMKGKAMCWGGRNKVREVLYEATLTAIRWNARIQPFYARLTKNGKPHQLAMVACMRKFLTILNAMARDGVPFTVSHPVAA